MRRFTFIIIALLFSSTCFYFSCVYSQGTYKLVIKVMDRDSIPVSEASVRVTTKWGPDDYRDVTPILSTDSSGTVVYESVYSVDASAHVIVAKSGIGLASGDHALTYPTTYITIICQGLASLTVHVEDSSSQPLQNAQVKLKWEGGGVPWTLSQTTESQGTTVFQQMSFHSYRVQVFWQSLLVYQGTFNFSETARSHIAQCNVHDLTVNVFDAANKPLSNAKVTVTRNDQWKLPAKYTDQGVTVFPQLADATYTVQAQYELYSNTATLTLSSSQTLPIQLNYLATTTYNIAVKAVWSDGKPVSAATVTIQDTNGTVLFNGIANSTGFAVVQLTEGAYTFTVSRGNLTRTQTANITSETTITVTFDTSQRVSTLTVEVYNPDQTFAYSAVVELYSNDHLLYNLTAVDGTATFSLPDGTYTIVAKFQDKRREETVTINQDTRLPIVFQTEINLTIIYSLIAVVAVTVFAIILIRRRKSRNL